jgi:hypothetical protein
MLDIWDLFKVRSVDVTDSPATDIVVEYIVPDVLAREADEPREFRLRRISVSFH